MSRLISANLNRAFKGKLLWLVAAASLGISCIYIWGMFRRHDPSHAIQCLEYCLNGIPLIALLIPSFTGLFLGDDYRCGTLRTKILSGASRESVYISGFVTVFVCSLIILAALILPTSAAIMIFVNDPLSIIETLLLDILASVMITASLSAIFTLIGMLISSKSAGAVAAIIFAFVLIISASYVDSLLCEPKEICDMSLSVDGVVISGEPHENPQYVGGWLRTVFEALRFILPTGQAIQIANNEMTQYLLCCTISLSVTVIISLFGVMFFSRKDLR